MTTPSTPHPYPPPGTISGQSEGRGGEYVYPLPEEPSHDAFERDEVPGRYDVTAQPPHWAPSDDQ